MEITCFKSYDMSINYKICQEVSFLNGWRFLVNLALSFSKTVKLPHMFHFPYLATNLFYQNLVNLALSFSSLEKLYSGLDPDDATMCK